MRTIWKYELNITDTQTLEMPKGAKILSVSNQRGKLQLWALVDDMNDLEDRDIEILATGEPVPYANTFREFIGTVVIDPFVWHVFERVK